MTARDTSVDAYHGLGPKLGQQAARIVSHVTAYGGDFSRTELSRATGISINAVCGRINELVTAGVLVESEPRQCSVTGKRVHPVMLPAVQMSLGLAA